MSSVCMLLSRLLQPVLDLWWLLIPLTWLNKLLSTPFHSLCDAPLFLVPKTSPGSFVWVGSGWYKGLCFCLNLSGYWRGARSHGVCCLATTNPTHRCCGFTWASLTWHNSEVPIQSGVSTGASMSEFRRRKPALAVVESQLLINVSTSTGLSWRTAEEVDGYLSLEIRKRKRLSKAGDVGRQDTWVMREMDTTATLWGTVTAAVSAPPL